MGYERKPTICRACLALLAVCLASLPPFSDAADYISMGQSLRDGQTIVSAGDKFELGFFTPPNSTGRYVGIWYYMIPRDAVIWVANRDRPISHLSGVLTFAADGNLVVQDGNQTIWSTNVNATILNATAQLSEFGNLELQDRFQQRWWESFENPTDTYVPGMRTGLNKKTGRNTLFHSSRSPSDPATGNFSMGMDPQGRAQIVVFEGSRRHWRSGQWDGQMFTGIPTARPHYPYGFRLSDDDQEGKIYFTYTLFDPSALLRFVLTWDGIEEQLIWNKTSQTWKRFWAMPIAECEYYNKCGAFGVCRSWATQRCECMKGYVPRDEGEWGRGNWSGGCVKRVALKCERRNESEVTEEDGFYRAGNVKLPDFSEAVTADGKDTCEKKCLSNCSCMAYAYGKGIGCAIWETELLDIERYDGMGNVLYLRLAHSELEKNNQLPTYTIVIIAFGGIILVAAAYLLYRKRKTLRGPRRKKEDLIPVFDFGNDVDIPPDSSGSVGIGERKGKGPDLPLVSFSFVASVTDNFSYKNKLGEGGFGSVYKGMLPSGQVVAIKRLSKLSGQGLEEFKNEVILIARLQHRNLVRLVGFCVEGEEKMLLYEYMPNKSLDAFLFDARYKPMLDWTQRFNIILGIARGLVYLHRDSRLRIIHRDLKPSNILLDEEMNPKISDFGMARIFGGNQNHANTNRVVGTYGYMSPEYAMEGLFSTKSDVYSFGVLILEIVSGKKNAYFCHPDSLLKLLAFAWRLWNTDRAIDFVDPSIRDSCVTDEVMRCIHVGLLCVQDERMDRPDMSAVVLMLESEVANHPEPKQPTFIFGGSSREMVLEQRTKSSSKNEVSITMSTGR